MHLIWSRKFCITFVFHFLWVLQPSQGKLKTVLMQKFGGQVRLIMRNVEVAYGTKRDFLLFIRHLHISYNTLCPPPPLQFFHTPCTLFPLGVTAVPRKLKTALAKQGLLWKMWKWRILPFSFFTFLFTNLTRGMSIIVGLMKMTYFAKLANLSRIHQRSGQKIKWDNKKGLLAVGDFHENGKLEKLGNWARIHQRFVKTSNEVTKTESLTNGDYKRMANFGRKREISAKMASMPKIHQGYGQIF